MDMSFLDYWRGVWVPGYTHRIRALKGGVQAQVGERSKDWGGVGGLAVYGTRVYEPLLSTLWQYTRCAGTLYIHRMQWHDAKRLGPRHS